MSQHDPSFKPGQGGSDAEVDSFAKGNVALARRAVESELVWIIEERGVAVGCAPQ